MADKMNDLVAKVTSKDDSLIDDVTTTAKGVAQAASLLEFLKSYRLRVAGLMFFCAVLTLSSRSNMSMSIVCMVNKTAVDELAASEASDQAANVNMTTLAPLDVGATCEVEPDAGADEKTVNGSAKKVDEGGSYVWTESDQSNLIGAFYYGYIVSQLPGGYLSSVYGGKYVLFVCLAVTSLLTLLTPLAASLGVGALFALRVVLGIVAGPVFPTFNSLLGAWAPAHERSRLATICYSGVHFANVVTFPTASFLCINGFAGGWPSIFYLCGLAILVWCALWLVFGSSRPDDSRFCSVAEKAYLAAANHAENKNVDPTKTIKVPWKNIVCSRIFWVVILINFCSDWGFYMLLSYLPKYLNEVIRLPTEYNGIVTSVPFLTIGCSIALSGIGADALLNRGIMSLTNIRRLFNSIGLWGTALCLLILPFFDCTQRWWVVGTLFLAGALNGQQFSGWPITPLDATPRFAGIIFGTSNALSSIAGFGVSALAGSVLGRREQTPADNYTLLFRIAAGVMFVGGLVYALLVTTETQPWNDDVGGTDDDDAAAAKRKSTDDGDADKELLRATTSADAETC